MSNEPSISQIQERDRRIREFLREAEAYLAAHGSDPTIRARLLPGLAKQFGLTLDEYDRAIQVLYRVPPPISKSDSQPHQNGTAKMADSDLVESVLAPEPEKRAADEEWIKAIRPQDLVTFVQQGRLILADQRGFTGPAISRLHHLADHLLIPHNIRPPLFDKLADQDFDPVSRTDPNSSKQSIDETTRPVSTEAPKPVRQESPPPIRPKEVETAEQPRPHKKKERSPSRNYKRYLNQALEALSSKRVNARREQKLIAEGTTKLGLSEFLARDLLVEVAKGMGYELESESSPELLEAEQESDELITTFQHRAAMIIAGQGGVNSLSRVMIDQAAKELGISDNQRDEALASVQKQSQKTDENSKQQQRAEAFRPFLVEKLEKLGHGIINASLARKLIRLGVDMHGLTEEVAQTTLREVVQQEEMRLVSRDQAESHIRNLIDDILEEDSFLSIENRKRLLAEGKQWGLDQALCQQLVEDHVTEYEQRRSRSSRRNALIFGMTITTIVTAGVYFGVQQLSDPGNLGSPLNTANQPGVVPTEDPTQPNVASTTGEANRFAKQSWWSEPLALGLIQLHSENPDLGDQFAAICTTDETQRGQAYGSLVSPLLFESRDTTGPERFAVQEVISRLIVDEPSDDNAQVIIHMLIDGLDMPGEDLKLAQQYQLGLEQAKILALASGQQDLSQDRQDSILRQIKDKLIVALPSDASIEPVLTEEITAIAYRKLDDLADKDPDQTALVQNPISVAAQLNESPERIVELDSEIIPRVVSKMEAGWEQYEPVVQRVVDDRRPELLLPLLVAFEQSFASSVVQREVAVMLSQKIGYIVDAEKPIEGAALVREELGLNTIGSTAEGLFQQFGSRTSLYNWQIQQRTSPGTAKEIIEIAHFSALGHAAAEGEIGRRIFEQLEEDGLPEFDDTKQKSAQNRVQLRSEVDALIERISNSPPGRSRANFYQELANRADAIDDVNYEYSIVLARYFFLPKGKSEQDLVLQRVHLFSGWVNLKLAIADNLHLVRRDPREIEKVVNDLLLEPIQISSLKSGSQELREALLRDVLSQTRIKMSSKAGLSADLANQTAEILSVKYRLHASLAGVPSEQVGGIYLPHLIAEKLIESLKAELEQAQLTSEESAELAEVIRLQQSLSRISESPLSKFASYQRIWLRLLILKHVRKNPGLAANAQTLLVDLADADDKAGNLFEQIRQGEFALVQLWKMIGKGTEG